MTKTNHRQLIPLGMAAVALSASLAWGQVRVHAAEMPVEAVEPTVSLETTATDVDNAVAQADISAVHEGEAHEAVAHTEDQPKADLFAETNDDEVTPSKQMKEASQTVSPAEQQAFSTDIQVAERFVTEHTDAFNQIMSVALTIANQGDTPSDKALLDALGSVLTTTQINHDTLTAITNVISEIAKRGDDVFKQFSIPTTPIVAGSSNGNGTILGAVSATTPNFSDIFHAVQGTTQQVIALVNQGKQPTGSAIGAIIDSIIPSPVQFAKIGNIIQRITEIRFDNAGSGLAQTTDVVQAIAELLPSELEVNGTPVYYILNKLGSMTMDLGLSVINGMTVQFNPLTLYNPATYLLRGQVAAKAIELIETATSAWVNKPQIVHSKAGLEITHAIMTVIDPFSTISRLSQRLSELNTLAVFGNHYRDITRDDIATTYVKAKLDKAIWDIRTKRDEFILAKAPFPVYHALNQAITKAVGVQLWGETRVHEVDDAIKALNIAYNQAESALNAIPRAKQIAPNSLKRELTDLITHVRLERDANVLGKAPAAVYNRLNNLITKAVGLQFNSQAKTVDVERMMKDLTAQLAEAKAAAEQAMSERATQAKKAELAQLITEVRWARDTTVLGKVPFKVYHQLNQAITKAVGAQFKLRTTVAEIEQAKTALRDALAFAQTKRA